MHSPRKPPLDGVLSQMSNISKWGTLNARQIHHKIIWPQNPLRGLLSDQARKGAVGGIRCTVESKVHNNLYPNDISSLSNIELNKCILPYILQIPKVQYWRPGSTFPLRRPVGHSQKSISYKIAWLRVVYELLYKHSQQNHTDIMIHIPTLETLFL